MNLSGEIISLKLNQGLTLEPGKHYSFNATITHDQATINSVSVTAWNNDSDPITPLPAEKVIPYVTFSAESQQGFKMTTNSYTITDLEYSVNNGEWTPVTANAIVTFGGDNGNLRLRGKNQKGTATGESNYSTISFTDNNVKVACTGDIRTLLDYEYYKTVATDQARFCKLFHKCTALTSAPELPATSLAERCYLSMFYGCTALKKAPEILPATTLADFCYYQMFFQCTALTTAPALPAKTLTDKCYLNMFYQCTALTTAPALPATTLAVNCYQSMFNQCTALAVAPELPATILMNYCYSGMFQKCTALKEAPVIKAEQLADNCCSNMFMECTSLTKAPELKAKETKNGCYSNMFYKCTALEIAPDLPATNLATSCYTAMFRYCNKLKYVKMLTTETQYSGLEDTRLSNWLADAGGDASSRTLILYSKAVYDAIKKYSYYLADNWKIGKATVKDKDGNTLTD